MPVDLDRKGSTSRLHSRESDLESRRAKGEVSCAECRRLKLKCDRKIPCTSCVRRGCQTICPNGSLAAGQGTRFVLANTDRLHCKLLEMSKRIRQLEDALQITQASVTPASHPLLSKELLAIKSGVDVIVEGEHSEDDNGDLASGLCSELGTLSISERGEACFMGRSSSEALLMVINESLADQIGQDNVSNDYSRTSNPLPHQIMSVSKAFPFASTHLPKAETLKIIEARLPSYARATSLVEAYLTNIAWSFIIVEREQIFKELLPTVYKHSKRSFDRFSGGDDDDEHESDYVHHLALLLTVLAGGAAGDLTLPIANEEAEHYIHLARATLSLNSVFVAASMENVQAVLMLSAYDFCSSRKYSLEPSWKMLSFGLSLASSIGLHRDPARWKMEPKIVQSRRRLFWEVFTVDKWKSLESGRPATFNLREVDCEFPEDKEATLDENGSVVPSFWRWKYRFTKEVLAPIAEQLCLTRPIKYAEILELDRKLRDFEMHPSISLSMSKTPDSDEDIMTVMRRYNWAVLREIALLFVHRSFFARAMLENPKKPLGSPFVSSLLSGYASAITLLNIVRIFFEKYSYMLLRQWVIWAHALTSAVIVGSVACRGPASHVAAAALKELEAAVDLFKKAQIHPVPRRGLPFLQRLLEKARSANQPVPSKDVGNARQELSILGGVPLFLNNANKRSSTSSNEASPTRGRSKKSVEGENIAHIISPGDDILPGKSFSSQQGTSASLPQSLPHYQCFSTTTDAHNTTFLAAEESERRVCRNIGETMTPVFANNLSQVWPTHFSTIASDVSLTPSSFPISRTRELPVIGQLHRNAQEISSTSWLEELSNNMSERFGQRTDNDSSSMNLDFLMGRGTVAVPGGVPRPEQGDDPVIAEAWRTLMTDSQIFDPETSMNL